MKVPTLQGIMIGFAVLSAVFLVLQALWPSIPGQRVFRKGFFTDLLYWVFTPLVSRTFTRVAVGVALVPLALAQGLTLPDLLDGHGPLAAQPLWQQAIQIFLIADFIGYWQHRWFHAGWRWPFHAVHHSSEELDWLSSVRLHPLNDLLTRLFQAAPIVALGYNVGAVALYSVAATVYGITLHANLNWTYGPFRYVISSPAFHRWHHTSAAEGQDKNFGGFFPIWDLIFGTFYMPRDRQPDMFGVDDPVPRGLIGQLVYPFTRAARHGD